MYCKKCGKELKQQEKFCKNCGYKVGYVQPNLQTNYPAKKKKRVVVGFI